MTPARFSKIGELIYGPSWRGKLAAELGVSQRTLYRWLDGTAPITYDIPHKLSAICDARSKELARMALELKHGVE